MDSLDSREQSRVRFAAQCTYVHRVGPVFILDHVSPALSVFDTSFSDDRPLFLTVTLRLPFSYVKMNAKCFAYHCNAMFLIQYSIVIYIMYMWIILYKGAVGSTTLETSILSAEPIT